MPAEQPIGWVNTAAEMGNWVNTAAKDKAEG